MQGKLSDLISNYSMAYKKRLINSPSDAREYAALIDFYIKIALTLLAAYSLRTNFQIRLGATPGVGAMLSGIRQAKKWNIPHDPVISGWQALAEELLEKFSFNIYDGKSFKTIRDELSHGNAIPSDDALANEFCAALRSFSEVIGNVLTKQLEKFDYATTDDSIALTTNGDTQEISPVWNVNLSQRVIGVYSSFDTDGVYYLCPTIGTYCNTKSDNTELFREKFLTNDALFKHFGRFVYEITRDIAGFSEDHSSPPYAFGEGEHAGVIFVTWTQATSQGNLHRTDSFRRGQDNRYEWLDFSTGHWVGFSSFLRGIVNWSVLARRLRIDLEEQEKRKRIIEIGNTHPVQGMKIPPVLLEEAKSPDTPQGEPIDILARVDSATKTSKNFTTVLFVVGDAGLGKTDHLLTLALKRAREVEMNPASGQPLYLFVTSTGRALSNLDDAINTSLSITRILDNQSAKVLCRNGLLVLIVDGFDELLGSSGYDNPLGSLEGWFRDLLGRGVILASARSSYYMTRYRRSLTETTNLNVSHTVAHIQPWSRESTIKFLNSYGIREQTQNLDDRDWRLLGIPFFATAFATWCANRSSITEAPAGIFWIVVNQYLERESTKISDQNNAPVLSTHELQALFSEFAEMMHLAAKRELEQSDLELCATAALNIEDLEKSRPGLKRRLTSLCGLSAGDLVIGDNRFGFSHEVIFDAFLSLALTRSCEQTIERAYLVNFFSSGTINPAVIEWFVVALPEKAATVLNMLVQITGMSPICKRNVGSLWAALLRQKRGAPPHLSASGLMFQEIDISKGHGSLVIMRDASIEELKICSGAATLDIKDTLINYLEVDSTETLRLLRNISPEMVQKIQSPELYCDTTSLVRSALEDAGVIPKIATPSALEWRDTVISCFQELTSRPDVPIVVFLDDFAPDGPRLGWAQRLGIQKWANFINRLTQCGLADLDTINGKGRPKGRLLFRVSLADISRRNSSIPGISEFWGNI